MSRLAYYRDTLRFDRSTHIPFTRQYRIQCSACAALVISGVPCHEIGCPQATRECNGCNARIPVRQKYCEDCQ